MGSEKRSVKLEVGKVIIQNLTSHILFPNSPLTSNYPISKVDNIRTYDQQ